MRENIDEYIDEFVETCKEKGIILTNEDIVRLTPGYAELHDRWLLRFNFTLAGILIRSIKISDSDSHDSEVL